MSGYPRLPQVQRFEKIGRPKKKNAAVSGLFFEVATSPTFKIYPIGRVGRYDMVDLFSGQILGSPQNTSGGVNVHDLVYRFIGG